MTAPHRTRPSRATAKPSLAAPPASALPSWRAGRRDDRRARAFSSGWSGEPDAPGPVPGRGSDGASRPARATTPAMTQRGSRPARGGEGPPDAAVVLVKDLTGHQVNVHRTMRTIRSRSHSLVACDEASWTVESFRVSVPANSIASMRGASRALRFDAGGPRAPGRHQDDDRARVSGRSTVRAGSARAPFWGRRRVYSNRARSPGRSAGHATALVCSRGSRDSLA